MYLIGICAAKISDCFQTMYQYIRPKDDNTLLNGSMKHRAKPSIESHFSETKKEVDKGGEKKENSFVLVHNGYEPIRFDEIRARISDIGREKNDIDSRLQEVLKIAADMETKHKEFVKSQNDMIRLIADLTAVNVIPKPNQ